MIPLSGILACMKTRRKQRETRAHGGLWTMLVIMVGIGAVLFGTYKGAMALVDEWCKDLPDVTEATQFGVAQKSRIYANDGETLLAELYVEDREPIEIDQVSEYVLKGTVATEDVRFYEHDGVDLHGVMRAIVVNLTGGQEGASTITQQFVRNTLLADEMTEISFKRKIREMQLAVDLEKVYSKDEILMMYLNTINYGDGKYGIEAAAQHYYSTSAADLTIAQAATLIGIPNSPTLYSPTLNPENCLARRNVVLSRMLTNGVITQEEYDSAIAEDLNLNVAPEDRSDGILRYPWFTSYVREQLLSEFSHDEIFKGGLTVITSLDPTMQEYAEQAAQDEYDSGSMADDQEIALTCIDPSTGFIKAMIGGRDYNADQFNIATASGPGLGRQAGSSFKMFTLTAAIEQGISPSTRINCDGPYQYGTWEVDNYGGEDYGILSIADMTAVSSNTGYARLVTQEGGVNPASIVDVAHRMGITSDESQGVSAYPALTLGTAQVNTTQMASAYATLAADGVHRDPIAIVKITNKDGEVIEDRSAGSEGEQVISPEVAYAVTQVLEGVINSSWGTAGAAALPSGQIAAGKTGTSENWRDLWWCGYTPQLSCSVWVGCREEREQYTDTWAQDVWRNFMTMCLEGSSLEYFQTADEPNYFSSFVDSDVKKKEEEEEKKKQEEEDKKKDDEESTDPETPTDPEKPTDPETPTDPEKPVDPETPTDPETGDKNKATVAARETTSGARRTQTAA